MTRIRYKKEDKLLTAGPFVSSNGVLMVTIYPSILQYVISNPKPIKAGYANSLPTLKKKIKRVLKELGCSFYDEIRKKPGVEVLTYD